MRQEELQTPTVIHELFQDTQKLILCLIEINKTQRYGGSQVRADEDLSKRRTLMF
jgi:hypothetical protein